MRTNAGNCLCCKVSASASASCSPGSAATCNRIAPRGINGISVGSLFFEVAGLTPADASKSLLAGGGSFFFGCGMGPQRGRVQQQETQDGNSAQHCDKPARKPNRRQASQNS